MKMEYPDYTSGEFEQYSMGKCFNNLCYQLTDNQSFQTSRNVFHQIDYQLTFQIDYDKFFIFPFVSYLQLVSLQIWTYRVLTTDAWLTSSNDGFLEYKKRSIKIRLKVFASDLWLYYIVCMFFVVIVIVI